MNKLIKMTLLAAGISGGLALGASAQPATSAPAPAPQQAGHAHSYRGQNAHWRHAMRRNGMRRLARYLRLDPAQREQVKQIHAKAMADIWAARADQALSPDQRAARIRAASEAGRAAFRGLLNPEQQAKLQGLEDRRERRLMGM
jgi:Spy/CpxP family protein refolding chaperone